MTTFTGAPREKTAPTARRSYCQKLWIWRDRDTKAIDPGRLNLPARTSPGCSKQAGVWVPILWTAGQRGTNQRLDQRKLVIGPCVFPLLEKE